MRQACGNVKSFKRLITPANKPQGFGFAEFEDPDGALRAMALLNNVELPALEDGCVNKKLLVSLRDSLHCKAVYISRVRSKRTKRPRCSLMLIKPSGCKQTCVVAIIPTRRFHLAARVAHIRARTCWQHVYVAIGAAAHPYRHVTIFRSDLKKICIRWTRR